MIFASQLSGWVTYFAMWLWICWADSINTFILMVSRTLAMRTLTCLGLDFFLCPCFSHLFSRTLALSCNNVPIPNPILHLRTIPTALFCWMWCLREPNLHSVDAFPSINSLVTLASRHVSQRSPFALENEKKISPSFTSCYFVCKYSGSHSVSKETHFFFTLACWVDVPLPAPFTIIRG